MIALWLLACVAPRNPTELELVAVEPLPPDIVESELGCSLDDDQWLLTLSVSGWGGQARSYWSADGLYVEDHVVGSQSYAEDGTGQDYLLSLSITADFRLAEAGSATALSCASNPSVLVSIEDLDGAPHDCIVFPGVDLDWSSIEGVPACP